MWFQAEPSFSGPFGCRCVTCLACRVSTSRSSNGLAEQTAHIVTPIRTPFRSRLLSGCRPSFRLERVTRQAHANSGGLTLSLGRGGPTRAEQVASDRTVVERNDAIGENLERLAPLAGDRHDVTCAGVGECAVNCEAAIGLNADPLGSGLAQVASDCVTATHYCVITKPVVTSWRAFAATGVALSSGVGLR